MKTIVKNSAGQPLRKKKIFWLSYLIFGHSNVVSQTEMVKCLSKDGADVYLFAVGTRRDSPRKSGARFILFPMKFVSIITPLLYMLALFVFMPFYTIVNNPDYIITDEGTAMIGFFLRLFLPKLKAKVVLDIRTTPITVRVRVLPLAVGFGIFRLFLNAFMFRVSTIMAKRKFDGMTILTNLMKEKVCREFNIKPEFVGVWHSGVSAELFNPENFDGMEIKKKLGLEDKFVIFYHGALGKYRGIDETIKSIGKLRDQFSELVFFVLGQGWYEPYLKRLAKEIAVQDKIVFHKQVPYSEVPKYIAMSDVGIVPLPDLAIWRYQCPLKVIEYLSMKKVVIATDIPANREIIGENRCGIYISSNDSEEIAKGIAFAYDNREKLSGWGSVGRDMIKDKYTWEKIAVDFENYLLSL
jgi:colanic acid biosynthesis glycosyl transferase WcaI